MTSEPEWACLSGWETTSAGDLVRAIDVILPASWQRICESPGIWRWESPPNEDLTVSYGVTVNGTAAKILVPRHGWPADVGPTLLAYNTGVDPFVTVTLPQLSDRQAQRNALKFLAQVVPALDPPEAGQA